MCDNRPPIKNCSGPECYTQQDSNFVIKSMHSANKVARCSSATLIKNYS